MQQLAFHPAWDKAISAQDRAIIEQLFTDTYTDVQDTIMSPVVRVAINHKQELLVTALVHNFTHHSATFKKRLVFITCGDYAAEQSFTIPDLIIPPFTSMPWTFIFEADAVYNTLPFETLQLYID